jgi:tetratricopeptide (TPR) repeat protein
MLNCFALRLNGPTIWLMGAMSVLTFVPPLIAASQETSGTDAPRTVHDRIRVAPLTNQQREKLESLIFSGTYKAAEELLLSWIEKSPQIPELFTLAGSVFFLDADPVNAAISLNKAARLRPLEAPDRFLLALAYIRMDRNDWAKTQLDQLASREPGNARYLYWLGRIDYNQSQYDSCMMQLDKATRIDPAFTKAWDNLGLCQEAAGKREEALTSYTRANHLNEAQNTHSVWPPLNLGKLLFTRGRTDEAETWLRKAVEYDPKSSEAHYRLGRLLEQQSQPDAAIAEFTRAAALDVKYADPLYGLARIYRNLGKKKEAAEALDGFEKRRPKR